MTLFKQYIEYPSQLFQTIDSVVMPDKAYKVDSTLIDLYSLMMNHQDYSRTKKQKYYAESLDSLAYFTHSSRSTVSRKINQLEQMGLVEVIYRHKKTLVLIVNTFESLKEEAIIRRQSEREIMESIIAERMENLLFQNETILNQNETKTFQNETILNQNETKTFQNDVLNSSGTSSSANSYSISQSSSNKERLEGAIEEVETEVSNVPMTPPLVVHPSTVSNYSVQENEPIEVDPSSQCITYSVPVFTNAIDAYQYVVSMGDTVNQNIFNRAFGSTAEYRNDELNIYIRKVFA